MNGNSTPRDANFFPVYSGEGDSGLTLPWSIDSVTGRVLMEIHISSDNSPSAPLGRALKDGNFRNTLIGASDSTGLPLAAAIDQTNNLLAVDLVIE